MASVVLSLATILPVVYGIKELAVHGAGTPTAPMAAIATGAAVGVVFVCRQLRLADPLLDAASEAFTSGLNVVAAIGAVIFFALAVLTAVALRHVPPTGETKLAEGVPASAPGADHNPKEAPTYASK